MTFKILLDAAMPIIPALIIAFISAFGVVVGIAVAVYNIAKRTGTQEARSEKFEHDLKQFTGNITETRKLYYDLKDKYMIQEHILVETQKVIAERIRVSAECQRRNQEIYEDIRSQLNEISNAIRDHLVKHNAEKEAREEFQRDFKKQNDNS